eukprot:15460151-Alexandrium_andersonii.AAC.1
MINLLYLLCLRAGRGSQCAAHLTLADPPASGRDDPLSSALPTLRHRPRRAASTSTCGDLGR